MTVTILMDATPMRVRAARLEDDAFVRIGYHFPQNNRPERTSLYRVMVTSIDRRMNAAFCDMGNGQVGFLRREGKLPAEGSRLIVEVRREGAGEKGPDLTDRPVVRTPFASLLMGGEPRPGLFAGDDEQKAKDFSVVTDMAARLTTDGPLGLVDGRDPLIRLLMELAGGGIDEIVVTSGQLAAKIDAVLDGAVPISVTDLLPARDAFDGAEADALLRRVALPGGGAMIVDQAEALTAIDLDLGRQAGQSQKGAVSRLLMDAIGVIGRYALLAQLGGQIVVDIPRGAIPAPKIVRDQLTRALKPLGRISVPAVTPEGLCVVIAPKPGPSLLAQLTQVAKASVIDGRRLRNEVIAAQAYELLEARLIENRTGTFTLWVHPEIGLALGEGNKAYQALAEIYGARFRIENTESTTSQEAFHVT